MKPPSPDPLEAWVHRALRELPEEPAPAPVTARVMAELARRAALPWWRRNPSSWPIALRVTLIVLPLGMASLTSPLPEALAIVARQLDLLRVVASALRLAASALWQQVPVDWISVLVMTVGLCAFASLGLSVVARRLLVSAR